MKLASISTVFAASLLASSSFALDVSGWHLLDTVEIKEVETATEWRAEKTFPAALKAAAPSFTIEGYYVPIEPQGFVSSFLLIRDQEDCPFCGSSGGYGPSLEVSLKRPMQNLPPYSTVTLRGHLLLIDDPDTYMAFRLTDARVLSK